MDTHTKIVIAFLTPFVIAVTIYIALKLKDRING